ncbi:LacI family DNA-binding transcriptional regulator [Pleomorphovibrio marinus]|uniref:LacI family DNA-binding transcriptional regulator n=1 Tax=Pleomorphovibrio marinus TaxID=2164132 RepID=UPI000E0BD016|nr:LacI family DNA-binding transcriptional regulator [Pleomorphovibrio marinus]
MKLGNATIKDIAKVLGISPSTVSRALKDYPGISQSTKGKVKELAKKMNYRPNAVALSLRKSKSFTIGVIIPEVVHFFFSTVISGIEEVAIARGYNVILCQTNENYEREKKMVDTMIANQIDGLLVSHSKETENFDHFKNLLDQDFPVVFFDRIPALENTTNVIVDDFSGAYQAVSHLLQQGYQDVLHLAGPKNLKISIERERGYRKALEDNGKTCKPERIIPCTNGTVKESEDICYAIFNQPNCPDAVFASNDIAAAGSIQALKSLSIKVPEEVGVVGFSNWQFSAMIDPPMSTVSQPGFAMGEKSTQLLLGLIEHDEITPGTSILPTELIPRVSSRKKNF